MTTGPRHGKAVTRGLVLLAETLVDHTLIFFMKQVSLPHTLQFTNIFFLSPVHLIIEKSKQHKDFASSLILEQGR
jgi:hypothetical protein